MRTPKIKRLQLELDTQDSQQLTATVESESGMQSSSNLTWQSCVLFWLDTRAYHYSALVHSAVEVQNNCLQGK